MYILTNRINSGYISNLSKVKVPLKKKYIPLLKRLSELNYIDNFDVTKHSINILLRYYNNKPLIFLETISKNSYKQYNRLTKIKLNSNIDSDLTLYSSNKGILINDEMLLLRSGGKVLLRVYLLHKNILY